LPDCLANRLDLLDVKKGHFIQADDFGPQPGIAILIDWEEAVRGGTARCPSAPNEAMRRKKGPG
jgi:hypothetical protein